jgi:hypothetical protein
MAVGSISSPGFRLLVHSADGGGNDWAALVTFKGATVSGLGSDYLVA